MAQLYPRDDSQGPLRVDATQEGLWLKLPLAGGGRLVVRLEDHEPELLVAELLRHARFGSVE
jgi:hypothetical protein